MNPSPPTATKIPNLLLCGGAGFVGHNLIAELVKQGYTALKVLDKDQEAIQALQALYPGITPACVDLATDSAQWHHHFQGVDVVVMLQAQIGGHGKDIFVRNNVTSTRHVLAAFKQYEIPYLVHISSSVVMQAEDDNYSITKREGELLVTGSGLDYVVLRPTLMFGAHNVNHFAWLARFMRKMHVMPVPGNGKYIRQPLYVEDFCRVIVSCIRHPRKREAFNLTGQEKISYIECLRMIRDAMGIWCLIVPIPYVLFRGLLKAWALLTKKAAFNREQLKALTAGDVFEVIDWPAIFGVTATPLRSAITKTFGTNQRI